MTSKHIDFTTRVNQAEAHYLEAKRLCRKTALRLALATAGKKLQELRSTEISAAEREMISNRIFQCSVMVGAADKQQLPDFHIRTFFDYDERSAAELDLLCAFEGGRFQNASTIVTLSWDEVKAHFEPYLKKQKQKFPIGFRLFYEAYQQINKG